MPNLAAISARRCGFASHTATISTPGSWCQACRWLAEKKPQPMRAPRRTEDVVITSCPRDARCLLHALLKLVDYHCGDDHHARRCSGPFPRPFLNLGRIVDATNHAAATPLHTRHLLGRHPANDGVGKSDLGNGATLSLLREDWVAFVFQLFCQTGKSIREVGHVGAQYALAHDPRGGHIAHPCFH